MNNDQNYGMKTERFFVETTNETTRNDKWEHHIGTEGVAGNIYVANKLTESDT